MNLAHKTFNKMAAGGIACRYIFYEEGEKLAEINNNDINNFINGVINDMKNDSNLEQNVIDQVAQILKKDVQKDSLAVQYEIKNEVGELIKSAQEYLKFCKPLQKVMQAQIEIQKHQQKLKKEQKKNKDNYTGKNPEDYNKIISTFRSYLNTQAHALFVKTSLFEHKVNMFINQIPVQIFILKSSNDTIGFFSYNMQEDTLNIIAENSNMTLSDTTIRFNMTFEKAQTIVYNIGAKGKNTTGDINELLNFENYPVNFALVNNQTQHQEKLENFYTILKSKNDNNNNNNNLTNDHKKAIEYLLNIQEKSMYKEKESLDRAKNVLAEIGIIITYDQQNWVMKKFYSQDEKIYIPLTAIQISTEEIKQPYQLSALKDQNNLMYKYLQGLLKNVISKSYKFQIQGINQGNFVTVNQGQLKEAFLGHFYNLEQGLTTVKYQGKIYTVDRNSFAGYMAAMDTARARLWGDYNIKTQNGNYAISAKSEGAGMDIKQFIELAEIIIQKCQKVKSQPSEINIKRLLRGIQSKDIASANIQNSEFLRDNKDVNGDEKIAEALKEKFEKTLDST